MCEIGKSVVLFCTIGFSGMALAGLVICHLFPVTPFEEEDHEL